MKLLPIEFDEEELGAAAEANVLMNYEPNETEALDMIIPNTLQACFMVHSWRQLPVKTVRECRRWILQRAMQRI